MNVVQRPPPQHLRTYGGLLYAFYWYLTICHFLVGLCWYSSPSIEPESSWSHLRKLVGSIFADFAKSDAVVGGRRIYLRI